MSRRVSDISCESSSVKNRGYQDVNRAEQDTITIAVARDPQPAAIVRRNHSADQLRGHPPTCAWNSRGMTAGSNLRSLREKLGFTMRDVEVASKRLAREHSSEAYLLPISWLSGVETKGVIPSVHRLFSIAIIYRLHFCELFSWYGMDLRQAAHALETYTPLLSNCSGAPANIETVYMPVHLNPSFDPRKTTTLSSIVEQWGTVPWSHLERLSKAHYTYGYIGTDDLTMYPILLPGSFIQIDESRNSVCHSGWRAQWERPIYFVETRNGHICSWCTQLRDRIIIESHPLSPIPSRVFKHPAEAEVIGQVVGVAMKLASLRQDGLVAAQRTPPLPRAK